MQRRRRAGRPERTLRIIAGAWRGRRITFPAGTSVRPTPDRVRETVFNWLARRIEGARCLDLYAGTGILGLEALSRGAAEVWFVESDRALAAALRQGLAMLDANGKVFDETVERFFGRDGIGRFDIVFLDPPYAIPVEPQLARLPALLAEDALIYLERAAGEGLPDADSIEWRKSGRAGGVRYGLAAIRR